MAQCTAKSKRSGERCRHEAAVGRTVCHLHGGKSPRGIAASNYKHGRYSKDLPARMAVEFGDHLADPELIGLARELALIDTRTGGILRTLRKGQPLDKVWLRLQACMQDFRAAERAQDPDAGRAAIVAIEELIAEGAVQGEQWIEVFKLVELRRKTIDTEAKRLQIAHQVITADQVVALVGMLSNLVRGAVLTYVSDATVSRRILTEIQSSIERNILGGVPSADSAEDAAVAGGLLESGTEEAV